MTDINKKIILEYLIKGLPYIVYFMIAILIFYAIKKYYDVLLIEIGKVFNDTLKINGIYSRTSITMFTSFMAGTGYALYSLFSSGFQFDVFLVYMLIATGIKITDAYSKKLVGNVKPEEPKQINVEISKEKPDPEENSTPNVG